MFSRLWGVAALTRETLAASAIATAAFAAVTLATAAAAHGDEAYYSVRVRDLKLTEGHLPEADPASTEWAMRWDRYQFLQPYAVLDGEGEAYVGSTVGAARDRRPPVVMPRLVDDGETLTLRVPAPRKVTGSLYWPKPDYSGMVKLRFAIDSQPSADPAKLAFDDARHAHYVELMNRGVAGGAWFRHQLRQGRPGVNLPADRTGPTFSNPNRADRLDQTFGLFGGGMAVSENLQLDRALPRAGAGGDDVPLDKIQGISVAEIDWKPLLKAIDAAGPAAGPDPLASLVPADQHAALFPSFQAFVQVADRLAEQGAIILRLAEAHSKDSQLVARYERQLGVSIDGMGRIVGPKVIGGVAVTGSDPYFQSGTDVALVFETAQPEVLKNLLLAQVAVRAQQTPGARPVSGEAGGLSYSGMRSDDRRISSYVAVLPGALLLTNSPYQVERFAAVANRQAAAIASLDEFTFFRNRYPRGDQQESALVFLSDATIRRWCGPRWRIAASRELRDCSVLAELQAEYMDRIVKKQIEAGPLYTDLPLSAGGALTLTADGPRSTVLGDLAFMTPIAELKFDRVTQAEAEAYATWREGYQRNWRWAFDPIALRLSVAENRVAADLTVMPLIAGSEYRDLIAISRGAAISPGAGDRHDALAQLILAINVKSERMRSAGAFLSLHPAGAGLDPLGWVGQSIAVTVDRDPFWEELAKCKTEADREKFFEKNFGRIPVGLWVEVANGFKLTAFLTGIRALIEQSAPGMTNWTSYEYRGEPYVKITPTARALPQGDNGGRLEPQLFYVASGSFFFVTPSEALLKQALDRELSRRTPERDAERITAPDKVSASHPWLGSSVGLQVDAMLLAMLSSIFGPEYQAWMQEQSWSNLPILNEWRRRYPDQDPVETHARVWHERLVCPSGGGYVWNDQWQTMESTVYGHPGQPKTGPNAPPALSDFRFANFGLTFEEQGLRARVTLDRKAPQK